MSDYAPRKSEAARKAPEQASSYADRQGQNIYLPCMSAEGGKERSKGEIKHRNKKRSPKILQLPYTQYCRTPVPTPEPSSSWFEVRLAFIFPVLPPSIQTCALRPESPVWCSRIRLDCHCSLQPLQFLLFLVFLHPRFALDFVLCCRR